MGSGRARLVLGADLPEAHAWPSLMAPEGEDSGEHLHRKYGSTPEQRARNFETTPEPQSIKINVVPLRTI